jgi:hypothetical protein
MRKLFPDIEGFDDYLEKALLRHLGGAKESAEDPKPLREGDVGDAP